MGTEVHSKNLFPGYHSMRNVNEDSNSSNWHLFNTLTSGHYYDGFTPRTVTDAYSGHDKDDLKHKMLQHEAVFKDQVNELHRLYKRQQDIMDEVKRREFNKYSISIDASSSSSHMPVQKLYEGANMWQSPSFPLGNGNNTSRQFIFGAEISNSPLSSKDCEIVECRPSKVRKKLFDLQLPGDEYVDPEEGQHIADNQNSEISSYPAKENGFATKNGVKSFLDGGKKDGYTNTTSGQHFMRFNGLADLNEPVHGQDVDFLRSYDKPERASKLPFEGKSNGRDMFSSCLREPGNDGGNKNYTSQYFDTSKMGTPSNTMQHLHNKEFRHRGIYSESSSNNHDHSHFNQTPLLFNASSPYPFASTSNNRNSLSASWIKSADSLTHKLTSYQNHTSFLSSPKSHEAFKDKWHRNGNGFYNGSSSGSKERSALHSDGIGYRNCNRLDDRSQKIYKGSNFVDLTGTTTKYMDLNTVQNLSKEVDNSRKRDQTVLPWLRAKPVICENGDRSGAMAKEKNDSLGTNKKLLGFPIFGNFCVLKTDDSSAVSTSASKHRGIDINVTWDDDTEKQTDVKTDATEIKNFMNHFDLNSCVTEDDDLLVTESVKSSKKKTMEIDLEAPAVSETAEDNERKEIELETDLESLELEKIAAEVITAISSQKNHVELMSKTENDNDDDNDNDSKDDPLLWFVEVINSCEKNIVSATRETDEYEMLTLQLEETKEEDYMPMPLVPDFQEPDEVSPALTSSRPRRGQARRGRPRRDFQRDILPGMTSLSRHEITEDLQIFGGLMKATGHSWNLGSTRRNGKRSGAWGKRKLKAAGTTPSATILPPPSSPPMPSKQVNNTEVVGLDEKSLTGWGKTTRRPRRQRYAAGNTVAVQST